jgi:hypothetical protein
MNSNKRTESVLKVHLSRLELNVSIVEKGLEVHLGEIKKDNGYVSTYLLYNKSEFMFGAPSIVGILKQMEINLGKYFMRDCELYEDDKLI